MTKRLLVLFLCMLLAFTTACSSANGNDTPETTTELKDTTDTNETTEPSDTTETTEPSDTTEAIKMTEKDFKSAIAYIEQLKKDKKLSYAAFAVGNGEGEFFHWTLEGTNDSTLFDMASVTKAAVTTTLFLIAQSEGRIDWNDPLGKYLDAPADKADIPLWRFLSHTSGLAASTGLTNSKLESYKGTPDKIVSAILNRSLATKTGTKVTYSDCGFVLLAEVLEKAYGKELDALYLEKVAIPLGMEHSGYKMYEKTTDIAKHQDEANRVNDPTAYYLGNVSGNAGLFSNIVDMSLYATELSNGLPSLQVSPEIFKASLQNRAEGLNDSRAVGWNLVDEDYVQAGRLFPNGSFGHTGHTGTSIFVDPETGLWVVLLTNARNHVANEKVYEMRENFHNAVADDLLRYFLSDAEQ